ncbi:hypothetical protein REPUB_Repub05bG0110200 [Reevesia pubescens]
MISSGHGLIPSSIPSIEMLSLHFWLPQSKHPSSFLNNNHSKLISPLIQHQQYGGNITNKKARKTTNLSSLPSSSWIVHAMEKDSDQQFEVDREKAKEALQKLDQQLQTLSKKQVSTPKIRASDVKISRDKTVDDSPEISGSFLPYLTVGLLVFTIFYNVLFYSVIKPSIDGPESAPEASSQTESRGAAVLQ